MANSRPVPFKLRSKIWVEDDSGNVIFGMGRVKILEAIEKYGSINAAAKVLKMSYRAGWGRIKASEERIGVKLVVRQAGGASGGGSALTPYAKDLIREFKSFRHQVLTDADKRCEKMFLPLLPKE